MNRAAGVHSIEAIRDFRAALLSFCDDARDALCMLDIEARRGLQWIQEEQPQYWEHQVRQRGDAVLQARAELERARCLPVPGGHPTCREEKVALERAKQRVDQALDKVQVVRKWGRAVQHEVGEYQGRANQLTSILDGKMNQALSYLNRVLDNLDGYTAAALAPEAAPSWAGSTARTPEPDQPAAAQQADHREDGNPQDSNPQDGPPADPALDPEQADENR